VLSAIAGIEAFTLMETGFASPLRVCSAVTLAMAFHVLTATLLGAAIPLGFSALGRDPSMVAQPALSTLADLSGAAIYLFTVTALIPAGA